MKKIKRVLALFLAVLMVLSAWPNLTSTVETFAAVDGMVKLTLRLSDEDVKEAQAVQALGTTWTLYGINTSVDSETLGTTETKVEITTVGTVSKEIIVETEKTKFTGDSGITGSTLYLTNDVCTYAFALPEDSILENAAAIELQRNSTADGADNYKTAKVTAPTGLVNGVNFNGTITISDGTNSYTTDLSETADTTVYYKADTTYTYTIASSNYNVTNNTGSLTDTVEVGTVTPAVDAVTITTDKTATALAAESFTAVVKNGTTDVTASWGAHVTWTITEDTAGASFVDTAQGTTVSVNTAKSGSYKVNATVGSATDGEIVNVEKVATDLSISVSNSDEWDKEATVTVTLNDAEGKGITGKQVALSLTSQGGELNPTTVTTDDDGKAISSLKLHGKKEVTVQAAFAGDEVYAAAASASATYDPKAKTVEKVFEEEEVNLIFGKEAEVLKLALTNGKEGEDEKKVDEPVTSEKFGFEGEKDIVKVTYDAVTKEVTFTPVNAGSTDVTIFADTDNYHFQQKIKVNVSRLELKLVENSVVVNDNNPKTYNGNDVVTVVASVAEDDDYIGTTEFPTSIKIEDYRSRITDVKRNDKGEVESQTFTANFDFKNGDWSDEQKRNFKLSEEQEATLTVEPAVLKLTVGDTSRAFRSQDYEKELQSLVSVVEGFIANDSAKNLEAKGFKYPVVVDSSAKDDMKSNDTMTLGTHPDILILDTEYSDENPYNATNNYEFDLVDYTKGTLEITSEIVNGDEYVTINNAKSTYAYQENADATMYFGDKATVVFQLGGGYTNIYTTDGSDVTNGYEIEKEDLETIVTEKFILKKLSTDGTVEMDTDAEGFDIVLTYDGDVPTSEIAFGQKHDTVSALADAITFGTFGNKSLTADVTVEDVSGIKRASYYVYEISEDGNYGDHIQETVKDDEHKDFSVIGSEEGQDVQWESVDLKDIVQDAETGNFSTSFEVIVGELDENDTIVNNNYVVYVLVEDMVGNNTVYGSNGIVIENYHIVSTNIDVTTEGASGKDTDGKLYYADSVDVQITSEEDGTVYSGLKSVEYKVAFEDIDLNQEAIIYHDDLGKEGTPNVTLDELKNTYGTLGTQTEEEKVAVMLGKELTKSQEVSITAETVDFAGNIYTETLELVLDSVDPVIEESWSEGYAAQSNGIEYYGLDDNGEKVKPTYTAEITERYLDYEKVNVHITKDNEVSTITLESLLDNTTWAPLGIESVVANQSGKADETKTNITIVFAAEGVYSVSVDAADRATNPCAGAEKQFIIDYTIPVLEIVYTAHMKDGSDKTIVPGTKEADIYYANENVEYIQIAATIVERNFGLENKDLDAAMTVTADRVNKKENETLSLEAYDTATKTYANWKETEADTRVQYFTVNVDANYTATYKYTDLAGNSIVVYGTDFFTLDRVRPNGTIVVNGLVNGTGDNGSSIKTWINKFLNSITFGLFGQNGMYSTMTSSDITADVAYTGYIATSELLTKDALAKRTDWIAYTGNIPLDANKNVIVYEKVTDKAGNTEYFSTENLVADNEDPAPVITVTPSSPAWGKGVYCANDNPGFDVKVTDPVNNNSYSGLKEVTYKIVNGTTGAVETGTLKTYSNTEHVQSYSGHVNIDPEKFYSNDVQVTVTASDWSTNEVTSEPVTTLKIDNKAPIVKFSFDTSDVQNGKYYKNNKTLTITVDERNFDPSYTPTVTSTAGGGYSFSGWSTNGEITTGTVTFSGDSDYTVTFDCYDLAGNKSNTERLEEFTVDKTTPVINVSYDNNSAQNGNYYKAARTATIVITEHNFRASDVVVTTTASNGSAPSVSGWSTSGDRHTATVRFASDADYTFDISYVDMAGNNAADYNQDSFTVDLTNPTLEITGVANKSANKGTVAPVITIDDTNFIGDGVTITLTGAQKGKVNISGMATITSTANGQVVTFSNFADGMDDIYTLTARSEDKAGNETVKSIMFSVNRDGSAYNIIQTNDAFTKAPQDIIIEEINTDTLEFVEVSFSKDGTIVKLTEGKDYKVKVEGGEGQWKKYTYTILASCFEEEGEYSINISSTDRAENMSNNKVQSKNVVFVVDKTAPTLAVSNLDEPSYTVDTHQFTLNVKDNAEISYVEVYVDGELLRFEGEDLVIENGKLYIDIPSQSYPQTIKIIAYDTAGNATESMEYEVLVSSSLWVQFVNNTLLLYGSIALLAAIIAFIFFIIWKRKKDEEEEQKKRK